MKTDGWKSLGHLGFIENLENLENSFQLMWFEEQGTHKRRENVYIVLGRGENYWYT